MLGPGHCAPVRVRSPSVMPADRFLAVGLALLALMRMAALGSAVEPTGPGAAATSALPSALSTANSSARAFLIAHQQPDGSWNDAACAAAEAAWNTSSRAGEHPSSTMFCTSLCVLALASLPEPKDSSDPAATQAITQSMARAVAWLQAGQDEAGAFSPRSVEQAAATAALVAAARVHVPGIEPAAARATAVVLDRQRMLGEPPRTAWPESAATPDLIGTTAGLWSLLALTGNPAPRGTSIDDSACWLTQTFEVANSAIVPDPTMGGDATAPTALFPERVAVAPNGELTVTYSEAEVPATALACFELVGVTGQDDAVNALAAAAERDEFGGLETPFPSADATADHAADPAAKHAATKTVHAALAPKAKAAPHDWRRRFSMATALAAHRRDGELRLRWLAPLDASVRGEQRADGALAGSWDDDDGSGRIEATAQAMLILSALHRPWHAQFSPNAVLTFFARCQEADGSWNEASYRKLCDADPPSAPDAPGVVFARPAYTTALVVLCYLGAGYDHMTPNKFRVRVKSGLDFLAGIQAGDGSFDADTGTHALATMAVAEAYAMTGDPALKNVAQRGVIVLLQRQRPLPESTRALAWCDGDVAGRFDTWATTWSVMALKSALAGQLDIGDGMGGASHWLDLCWKAANPAGEKTPTGGAHFPASVRVGAKGVERCDGDATEWGLTCAVFLGHRFDSPLARSLARSVLVDDLPLLEHPAWDLHRGYMGTLGLFQVGGDGWGQWMGAWNRHALSQPMSGCATGSVDADGFDHAGIPHGRLGSTAFAALTQGILYRYQQVASPSRPVFPRNPK